MTDERSIRRYRHRPTEILAVRWMGDNFEDVSNLSHRIYWNVDHERLYVETPHGNLPVSHGQWVAKRNDEDVYPMTDAAMDEGYEPAVPAEVEGQLPLPGL